MRFNKKLFSMLWAFGLAALLVMLSKTAIANTPDGVVPANEGVCDTLQGGTPGLYGLCVAYCEAQDLDSVDKEPPNTRILDNYRKKMQDGDPDMPCIQAPCPCWSSEELASITGDGVVAVCTATSSSVRLTDFAPATRFAYADSTRTRCAYVDLNTATPVVRNQSISADDAQSCVSALNTACSNLGL